ncbi:hypothetical protein [Rhizobium leguminosarum]|uniref:hypothetical protein n=1 Tax=Rhizobium leguminosarum TaxID=384 RepID=UPI0004860D30|nr:hypothetical protein [Rhizobium leguminosarum]
MNYPDAEAIFEEFNVRIVPANVVPLVGETRAVATLHRIAKRHGEEHARFVVMTLAETANSKASINETALWAVSDLVLLAEKNFPHLVTTDVENWFKFFDQLPLGWIQFWSLDMDGIVPKRFAVAGMVYERMKRTFGPLQIQPDFFDDRRQIA